MEQNYALMHLSEDLKSFAYAKALLAEQCQKIAAEKQQAIQEKQRIEQEAQQLRARVADLERKVSELEAALEAAKNAQNPSHTKNAE